MKRREAVAGIGALLLTACSQPVVPTVANRPLSVNVYVHSGFASPRPEWGKVPGTQCPHQWPWAAMKKRDRIPERDEYDEREPWVTDYRLSLMQSVGISGVIYQVEYDHAA